MKKSCWKQGCGTQYSITLLRKEQGEKKGETERGNVEKKKNSVFDEMRRSSDEERMF